MDNLKQINQWFTKRNNLEKFILFLLAIAFGISCAFGRRAYWDYRVSECKKLDEFEKNDCIMELTLLRIDSFMGL